MAQSKAAKTSKTYQSREAADLALVDGVVVEMKQQLAVIAARREQLSEGGFDRDLAAAAAALGKVAISGAAERRNQRKASSTLTLDIVMGWMRDLPDADLKEAIAELTEWTDQGSLL